MEKLRKDGTYTISTDKTDNPKIIARRGKNGRDNLFLMYYNGYTLSASKNPQPRYKKEPLKMWLYSNPKTPFERAQNREVLQYAKKIRSERQQDGDYSRNGYMFQVTARNKNLLDFFDEYGAQEGVNRVYKNALNAFKRFLSETPEYFHLSEKVKPDDLTFALIQRFVNHLATKQRAGGVKTYFALFRAAIRCAVRMGIIKEDPTRGVRVPKTDVNAISKDILSTDEILRLFDTDCEQVDTEVKRAFLFSCYTGLRFCDVSKITYDNVDFGAGKLSFEQSKVAGHSSHSNVTIPLNETLLMLIDKPQHSTKEHIFKLMTYEACTRHLRVWIKAAGINKHITWHSARHSFGVNVLTAGADIKTLSELMGHSSIVMTEKYLHVVDKRKQDAINSLPKLI